MTFVVMGLGTVFNALTNRRDPASGLSAPLLKAPVIALVPVGLIVLATELPGLQKGLLTTSLTGHEWAACFGLALLLPLVIETSKWIRRRRRPHRSRKRTALHALTEGHRDRRRRARLTRGEKYQEQERNRRRRKHAGGIVGAEAPNGSRATVGAGGG